MAKKKELVVEFNATMLKDNSTFKGNGVVMITPAIDKDYWLFRVHLYRGQYLQAFPKFTTLGIGFALEEDWNTNLPYSVDPEKLYDHIKHNKKYPSIPKENVIEAIKKLSATCADYFAQTRKQNPVTN